MIATDFATSWLDLAIRSLWEGSLLFAIALLLWWPIRRRASSQLGQGLFLLVLLKVALPVKVSLPQSLAWLSPFWQLEQLFLAAPTAGAGPAMALPAEATGPSGVAASGLPDAATTLFALWILGVAMLSLIWLHQQIATWRAIRRARPVRSGEFVPDPDRLRRLLGIRRPVRFLVTDQVGSPAAGGLLRPCVLLPDGLMDALTPAQRRWVLLHELAHIRRRDLWVALFQRAVQIAFFFHPLVWWANRIVDEQREFACDDLALEVGGGARRDCGAGFLSVVEWVQGHGTVRAGTLGMFRSKNVIRRRLMRILNPKPAGRGKRAAWTTALVAIFGACLLPSVRAQGVGRTARGADTNQMKIEILRERIKTWEAEGRLLRKEIDELVGRGRGGRDSGVSGGTRRRGTDLPPGPAAPHSGARGSQPGSGGTRRGRTLREIWLAPTDAAEPEPPSGDPIWVGPARPRSPRPRASGSEVWGGATETAPEPRRTGRRAGGNRPRGSRSSVWGGATETAPEPRRSRRRAGGNRPRASGSEVRGSATETAPEPRRSRRRTGGRVLVEDPVEAAPRSRPDQPGLPRRPARPKGRTLRVDPPQPPEPQGLPRVDSVLIIGDVPNPIGLPKVDVILEPVPPTPGSRRSRRGERSQPAPKADPLRSRTKRKSTIVDVRDTVRSRR